ncbi:MAG: hypothetical protein WDN76_00130 [Alphaproteobacteria bacterium]
MNRFGSSETIGFGVLSWRDRETLRNSLESYRQENFASLFDRALIYFQEIEDADRAIAAEFGFEAAGDETNRGILGRLQGDGRSAGYRLRSAGGERRAPGRER